MKRWLCWCLALAMLGQAAVMSVRAEEFLPVLEAAEPTAAVLPEVTYPEVPETATPETVSATDEPTLPLSTVETACPEANDPEPETHPETMRELLYQTPTAITPIARLSQLEPGISGVTVRGTVVWARQQRIVLQDDTGGADLTLPPEEGAEIGDILQLTGRTENLFTPEQTEKQGRGQLPRVEARLSQAPDALRITTSAVIPQKGQLTGDGRSLPLEAESEILGAVQITGVILDGVFYADEILPDAHRPEVTFRWNHYAGQLHDHSDLSGGWGSAEAIFAKSAQAENMDFFAVTDHSNSFENGDAGSIGTDGCAVSPSWAAGTQAAKAATGKHFVALFGFEMTWDADRSLGHINTFGTPGWQTGDQADMKTLEAYLDALRRVPHSVSQFNHPDRGFGNFNGFRGYDQNCDRAIQLFEVFGERNTAYMEAYLNALDAGWHLAPTAGSNCYDPDYGSARTMLLGDSLTEKGLLRAMERRRVYATQDGDLRLEFQINGRDMGSFVEKARAVELKAKFCDPSDGIVGTVEVLTSGGRVLATREIGESAGEFTLSLPGNLPYYLLRVTQPDQDVAISAPVWMEDLSDMGIEALSARQSQTRAGEPFTLEMTLFNREPVPMEVLCAELYLDDTLLGQFRESPEGDYLCEPSWQEPGELRLNAWVQAAVEGDTRSYQKEIVLHLAGEATWQASVSDARQGEPGQIYQLTGYASSGNTNPATTFPDTIYVQDATGGIPVIGSFPAEIQVGTPLKITGVLRRSNQETYLDLISWEKPEKSLCRPIPVDIACGSAEDWGAWGGRLVQVQGKLLSLEKAADGKNPSRLTIRDGKGDQAVIFIEPEIRSGSRRTGKLGSGITPGRTIRAVGLLARQADGTVAVRVRNCDEVVYVPPVPDKTNPRTADFWGTWFSQLKKRLNSCISP